MKPKRNASNATPVEQRPRKILRHTPPVLWAAGIFAFSSIPGDGLPENLGFWSNIGHFTSYLLLAALISLANQKKHRPPWKTALIAVAVASLYGVSDEFHQWFVKGRYADIFDWLTDTLGAIAGAAGTVWILNRIKRSNSCKDPQ